MTLLNTVPLLQLLFYRLVLQGGKKESKTDVHLVIK